jgi:hypothetical protein
MTNVQFGPVLVVNLFLPEKMIMYHVRIRIGKFTEILKFC